MLRRFWSWFTLPCAHCGTRLYLGSRVHGLHGVYCDARCYQIGVLIAQSLRKRGMARHG